MLPRLSLCTSHTEKKATFLDYCRLFRHALYTWWNLEVDLDGTWPFAYDTQLYNLYVTSAENYNFNSLVFRGINPFTSAYMCSQRQTLIWVPKRFFECFAHQSDQYYKCKISVLAPKVELALSPKS